MNFGVTFGVSEGGRGVLGGISALGAFLRGGIGAKPSLACTLYMAAEGLGRGLVGGICVFCSLCGVLVGMWSGVSHSMLIF